MSDYSVDRGFGFWFHKMPSNGRGEYEVTGVQDQLAVSDLFDREFVLEADRQSVRTGVRVRSLDGKRRVRIDRGSIGVQRQLTAMLLLPASTREERAVSNAKPIVLQSRFILDASFFVNRVDQTEISTTVTTLLARSGDIDDIASQTVIDFDDRSQRLAVVNGRSALLPDSLRVPFEVWWELAGESKIGTDCEKARDEYLTSLATADRLYLPGSDPLPATERLCGVRPLTEEQPLPIETPSDAPGIRLRAEQIYRLQRTRGASAARFAREVRKAYRSTCAFCGFYSPVAPGLMTSGVQAAHILPYGQFDLDVVQNGIMLCTFDHWAFDNHLLRLTFDAETGYEVVSDPVRVELFSSSQTSLDRLSQSRGAIATDFLPTSKQKWPAPMYIDALYAPFRAD